jgi:asparagine N-glycosylation enzyme membrane subunit Stt3
VKRHRRAVAALGIAAAAALGLFLRLEAERSLRRDRSPVRFVSVDCLYHMRRVRFAVAHFPRVLFFDPAINFPAGAMPNWPPLFDLALAAPARIAAGPSAPRETIDRLASFVPPALGAIAILFAGLLAGRVRRSAAVPVALFVALCGAHIEFSQYGHTDQHVAESATSLLALWLFLRARERPSLRRELAAAAALALAVLTWQGAIAWGALYALVLALEAARRPAGEIARAAAVILGGASAVVAAGVAYWLAGDPAPFAFVSFGWFQPAFLLALSAGTGAVALLVGVLRRPRAPRRHIAGVAGFVLLAAALLAPVAGRLLSGLLAGLGYVGRLSRGASSAGGYTAFPREWLRQIAEARPLLADGGGLAFQMLSAAFFLCPLAILIWLGRARRGPRRSLHLALGAWGVLVLVLAVSQRLNVYYAAPLAGLTAFEISRQAGTRLRRRLERRGRPRTSRPLSAAFGALLFATLLPGTRAQIAARYEPGRDLIDTMDWARRSLPHPLDIYDPRFVPPARPVPELSRASAMLGPWSLGHFLTYYAEEPSVADNFGYGFFDSLEFFLADREEDALAIARRRRARWIVATDLLPKMNDYGAVLHRGPYVELAPGGLRLTPAYFHTVQSRLYDFDGRGPEPLPHFRLIYRSRTAILRGGRLLSRWKIFEVEP